MTQGIYVDVLLTVNFLVDYLLLAAVQLLCRRQFQRRRLVLAALVGAAGSLSIFWPEMGNGLRWLWQFFLAAALCRIADRWRGWKKWLCGCVLLFAMGLLFGGALLALRLTAGEGWMLCANGVVYFHMEPLNLVLAIAIGFGAVNLYQRLFSNESPRELFYEADLWLSGRKIHCRAMMDTGNQLREPFSGWPVLVLKRELFPGNLPIEKLRMIPCKTVGGTALLPAVKGERLRLSDGLEAECFYIALSDDLKGCQLLLNGALINGK